MSKVVESGRNGSFTFFLTVAFCEVKMMDKEEEWEEELERLQNDKDKLNEDVMQLQVVEKAPFF